MSIIKLRDFQEQGVRQIYDNEIQYNTGSILAYDMGLGKTITFSSFLIKKRLEEAPEHPDLIIVPLSVMLQWKQEIKRLNTDMKTYIYHGQTRATEMKNLRYKPDFFVATYHCLVTRELEPFDWNRIVLDEAHYIRNGIENKYRTIPKRVTGAYSLRKKARFCHCITGTPFNNGVNDIMSLMNFVGYEGDDVEAFIKNFVIQKTKQDIMEPIIEHLIPVDRPDETKIEDYNKLMNTYVKKIAAMNQTHCPVRIKELYREAMQLMTKLRLYCDIMQTESRHVVNINDDEDEDEDNLEIEFNEDEMMKIYENSPKIQKIYENIETMIEDVPKKRIIVFSSFVTMLNVIETVVKNKLNDVKTFQYTGKVKKDDREYIVREFTNEDDDTPMILFASVGAGCVGLNLTPCSTVFMTDVPMNPFDQLQAINRVHRLTQINRVNVYKFYMKNMIEESIMMSHTKKITEAKKHGLLII